MGTMSRKPPPRALALWLCWARAYLLACCKFGSLLIGLFEWRPGLVPFEGLPLNIAQNTLRPMFRMCGATSSCLGKALMLSIYSSAFPPYCVELFKGCSANKLVAPGSCRDLKLAITVLMPQSSEPHHWFGAVACREGSWPMELPNPRPLLRPVTLRTFARLRHLSMSPHLWGTLNPDWRSGYRWLYLETPIVESAQSIERKFLARDNSNLTDKFAKSHARDALWRGFRRGSRGDGSSAWQAFAYN